MNKIQLSYVAGFFDGEGSINILKVIRKRQKAPEYTLMVAIGQKDGKTLDWLSDNFGGNVYLVKRDGSFYWAISNRKAEKLLRQLLPYLQYKKPQAELALTIYDEMPKRTRFMTQSEIERREGIRNKMMELHKTIIQSRCMGSTTKRVNPKGM
jgi:hypothetical protein